MNDFLTFMYNYWFLVIAGIAVISFLSIKVYVWFKKPTNEQIEQVKEWLIFAVAEAEKKLGSGTGQLKLRYVYNMFIAKFPAIALFIDFEDFSHMVDNALLELECMISSNDNIKNVIGIEDKQEES